MIHVGASTFSAAAAEGISGVDALTAVATFAPNIQEAASATDNTNGLAPWEVIDDAQTAAWQVANTVQTPAWGVIGTAQTASWQVVKAKT